MSILMQNEQAMLKPHVMKIAEIVYITFIVLLVGVNSLHADNQLPTSSLESLIEEALKNNSEIKSYIYNVEAYETRPSQARSLDDTRIGIAVANLPVDTFRFDQEAMTQKQISLKQKLPFPGKLSLKKDIAEKDLAIAQEDLSEKKNSVIAKVKSTYFDLLFLKRSVDVTERNRDLLAGFIETVESRYSVGKASQREVIKAQVELSGMLRKLLYLEQKQKAAEARLTSLLSRDVHTPFLLEEKAKTYFDYSDDNLMKIALERSMLSGLEYKVERAKLSKNLSEKEYYPDFDLGISYGQRDNTGDITRADFFSASITMNIPLWFKGKESKKVAEEEAKAKRAETAYETMRDEIYFQVRLITSEIDQLDKEIELLKTGLIPQSALSFDSTVSAYNVNKAAFLDLVRNQIGLYNYEIEYFEAVMAREKKLAKLEAVVGKRLFN